MTENERANKIIEALRNDRWDYRTVDGIAEETGLDAEFIRQFLDSKKDLVWKSSLPDKRGKELYSLKSRQPQSKDLSRKIRTFLSKQPS